MMTSIEALRKRTAALAPGPAPVQHIFLSSTDFTDETEREARRAELEKEPGNVVVLWNVVDGARPGDPEGMVRVCWKDKDE